MAPLPVNNTETWFLDYVVGGVNHTLEMRSGSPMSNIDASNAYDALLSGLSLTIYEMTVVRLRKRLIGSTVSLPGTWAGAATYGTGVATRSQAAQYIDFIGRTHLGRRARAAIFGSKIVSVGNDYRVNPGESAEVDAAILTIKADVNFWFAIDGIKPIWYPYANCGVNAYWRNRIR